MTHREYLILNSIQMSWIGILWNGKALQIFNLYFPPNSLQKKRKSLLNIYFFTWSKPGNYFFITHRRKHACINVRLNVGSWCVWISPHLRHIWFSYQFNKTEVHRISKSDFFPLTPLFFCDFARFIAFIPFTCTWSYLLLALLLNSPLIQLPCVWHHCWGFFFCKTVFLMFPAFAHLSKYFVNDYYLY